MKKIMTLAVAMATAAVCFANGDVQPTAEPTDNILGTEVSAPLSGSLTVKVYKRDGSKTWPYSGCKVSHNRDYETVRTDSDGVAKLSWSSNDAPSAIYVDGKKYEGSYSDGGSYTFYVDD